MKYNPSCNEDAVFKVEISHLNAYGEEEKSLLSYRYSEYYKKYNWYVDYGYKNKFYRNADRIFITRPFNENTNEFEFCPPVTDLCKKINFYVKRFYKLNFYK